MVDDQRQISYFPIAASMLEGCRKTRGGGEGDSCGNVLEVQTLVGTFASQDGYT
jgi:hypothetical protein